MSSTFLFLKIYNPVYSLFKGNYNPSVTKKNLPLYIPARNFALALTDIVFSKSDSADNPVLSLREAILKLPDERVRGALLALVDDARGDINKTRKNIEDWYDSGMDRVSGWYKRHVQRITLIVGLLIAIVVNVDTINMATRLSYDVTLRQALMATAQEYAKAPATGDVSVVGGDPDPWASHRMENELFSELLSCLDIKDLGMDYHSLCDIAWRPLLF